VEKVFVPNVQIIKFKMKNALKNKNVILFKNILLLEEIKLLELNPFNE